ncbi:uncharacterized protein LOC111390598 isoform X2 [Olea europaea var. sylvestris]|uniref:Uncharacterized protein n=1 Tax=Olea europaea subsp. europaea TaxID=158383 RepID=A0A8S0PZD9_OLEEU|nr:uncharacterized protein LOC111390598 isoform X2 [Olea europaea var. sylvestris]CAA2959041.1 Hypothetical predicted protein [Olea europaea subsp. europaea]
MCCDIDVVPEAVVNVNTTRAPMRRTEWSRQGDVNGVPEAILNVNTTRLPLRMEGNRQGDINVVPEVMVNVDTTRALVREEKTSHLDGDINVLVRRKKLTSPERSPQRKTTIDNIILEGSKADAS